MQAFENIGSAMTGMFGMSINSVVMTIGAIGAINGSVWQPSPDFQFIALDDAALEIFGNARVEILATMPEGRTAHEAPVWVPGNNTVWYASNRYGQDKDQFVDIEHVHLGTGSITTIAHNEIRMANGGTNLKDEIVFCAQGDGFDYFSAGLYTLNPATLETKVLLNNYRGVPFNSPNDVDIHKPTGSLWFTDPPYGHVFRYRDVPLMPSQVYVFFPATGEVRAVADQLVRPNGIGFSPDFKTLYVSDTGKDYEGSGPVFPMYPASIYAYDVSADLMLTNRRLFAYVDNGVPDGFKLDVYGRLYVGCGDGVHIFQGVGAPGAGRLLGKILTGGKTSANLVFAGKDLKSLIILCEKYILRVNLTVPGFPR